MEFAAMYSLEFVLMLALYSSLVLSVEMPKQTPLSSAKHESDDGTHLTEFDHEAFLGVDEAHRFDQLPEQEAKGALGLIFDRVDKDADGGISNSELLAWIQHVQQSEHLKQANKIWKQRGLDLNATMDIETYDSSFTQTPPDIDERSRSELEAHRAAIERRWKAADVNGDGNLSREEYLAFHSPSDYPHMKMVVIQEILDDMDEDKDGLISEQEYIAESTTHGDDSLLLEQERDSFSDIDVNSDRKIDLSEAVDWLSPVEYGTEDEARHLIGEADDNKDKQLSKPEVLRHWQMFVGSRATYYGEYKVREEL